MRIVTTKQSPAYTPDTAWVALDDQTYDGEGCAIGWGRTEVEAVRDLLDQIESREPDSAPVSPPATR